MLLQLSTVRSSRLVPIVQRTLLKNELVVVLVHLSDVVAEKVAVADGRGARLGRCSGRVSCWDRMGLELRPKLLSSFDRVEDRCTH